MTDELKESGADKSAGAEWCSAQSSGNLNLLNLCKDTVRIEAFTGNKTTIGSGFESSGVLMSEEGDIITADHDITASGVTKIDVAFSNGQHRSARVVAHDPSDGLALLHLINGESLPQPYYPLALAEPDWTPAYNPSLAFGYPKHALQPSAVSGVIGPRQLFNDVPESVLEKETPHIDRYGIAEAVSMNVTRGMSGGAVARKDTGEIIGIMQFALTDKPANASTDSGYRALLTPIDKVKDFLSSWRS